MEALKIEILNPKALKLIKGLQDLKLIKISENPKTKFKAYLKNMRQGSSNVPSLEEITKIVKKVRAERYAKK